MEKQTKYHLGIEIDKLTNSILNIISGDSFPTDVHPINKADLKNTIMKNGWFFNWANEYKLKDRQVFKLTIRNNPEIVQGLLSISDYFVVDSTPLTTEDRKKISEIIAYYKATGRKMPLSKSKKKTLA